MSLSEILVSLGCLTFITILVFLSLLGVPFLDAVLVDVVTVVGLGLAIAVISFLLDCRGECKISAFNAQHPGWSTAADKLETALLRAIYRWQLQEFGAASKCVTMSVHHSDGDLRFSSFLAYNDAWMRRPDRDLDAGAMDEDSDQLHDEREVALSKIKPSPEQERRLDAALKAVVERQDDAALARILLIKRKVNIDTEWRSIYS